ncbi:MAG TPA: hypothetical protein VJS64_14355 [Pyrinomonadaceae bacterium]|nr:hypothetical protein [Pyrinomonadaceae bacterium]
MKAVLRIIACTSFLLTLPAVCFGKEWRGITPMRSTREDVERLLGPPPPSKVGTKTNSPDKGRSTYFLDEGQVDIVFAGPEIPLAAYCVGMVPNGTVLMIQVTAKPGWTYSDFQPNDKEFRKFNAAEPSDLGYDGYFNEREGLVIRTFKGNVEQIIYLASAEDRNLCPSYYENPEAAVNVFVCGLSLGARKFDEYGDIPFDDEKPRLDNIAIELQQETGAVLYVIGYAGRQARVGEARVRAERAKSYLDKQLKAPGRVTTVDGGYRQELILEFFIVPAGATPPQASPTVTPSEVEFIYDDNEKPKRRRNP